MAKRRPRRWIPRPARAAARAWRYLPTARKARIWRVGYLPLELVDRALGRSGAAVPPRWLRHLVGGNYEGVGREYEGYFVDLGGLRPADRVLDIGCGSGRMALPLTRVLGPEGSYEGFDVVPEAVSWCQSHITPRYPRFRFQALDVRNSRYNPRGRLSADRLCFPYEGGAFDFAVAASLFTHLGRVEAAHYLREAARVLRPGGRLLATFFLLNAESLALLESGDSTLDFSHRGDGVRTLRHRPGDADFAVAFEEPLVLDMLAASGFALRGPIHRGNWCGRDAYVSYQDMIVAAKRPEPHP